MLKKSHIYGNSFVGVYSSANEELVVMPPGPECDQLKKDVEEILKPETMIRTTIDGANVVGALMVLSSNGALVSPFLGDKEKKKIIVINK